MWEGWELIFMQLPGKAMGFCNHWTLEISVSQPVRVYAGMPIGQLIYFLVEGEVEVDYSSKLSAKYNRRSSLPVESMMWKKFFLSEKRRKSSARNIRGARPQSIWVWDP